MKVDVKMMGLYNHKTQKDYKLGVQIADDALTDLANRKLQDSNGNIMVELVEPEQQIKGSDEVRADEAPADTDTDSDTKECGLDLNDPLQATIYDLLDKGEFNYSALTRAMGDDSKIQSKVIEWRKASQSIIQKLDKEGFICLDGKCWTWLKATKGA